MAGFPVDDIIDEIYNITGADNDDRARSVVLLDCNRSFWELMNKFNFKENESVGDFDTVAGDDTYATTDVISTFEALRDVTVEDPDLLTWAPVEQASIQEIDAIFNSNTYARGKPTKYRREGSTIIFRPVPDQVYTIQCRCWLTLQDLADSATAPTIPQAWHEIIMYGGLYRTFFGIGDVNRGDYFKKHTWDMMGSTIPIESKEQIDTKTAGISLARGNYISNYQTRLRIQP